MGRRKRKIGNDGGSIVDGSLPNHSGEPQPCYDSSTCVTTRRQVHRRTSMRRSNVNTSSSITQLNTVLPNLNGLPCCAFSNIYIIVTSDDGCIGTGALSPFYCDLGDCVCVCTHCDALFWRGERIKTHFKDKQLYFHRCCENGRVSLPRFQEPPLLLKQLLDSRDFTDNIRAYNQMFSMTSYGEKIDDTINDGRSPYVFKVSGQIYHWIGSMCPQQGVPPRFLQLYIYDNDHEVENRMSHFGGQDSNRLCSSVVSQLIELLDTHKELVKLFRTARDKCRDSKVPTFCVRLFSVSSSRQHTLPTSDAIGAIVFDSGPRATTDYDVSVEPRGEVPRRINKLHPLYTLPQFPLMFFYSEPGFHLSLMLRDVPGSPAGRERKMIMNIIELNRMDYIRHKQKDIRNEYLSGLYDAIDGGTKPVQIVYGNPQFFITFTCNVKWPEIARYLQPYTLLTPSDRADVVARVFQLRVREFVAFLKRRTAFWCIQRSPLYDRVSEVSLAKPSAPCMELFACSKNFRKLYNSKTYFDADGRAHYRRRNIGIYTTRGGVKLDNSYVVPYNLLLCLTFHAHINVEFCGWTMLIKYLFKYISKGTDRVAARITRPVGNTDGQQSQVPKPIDEIQNFIDARFICPHEACWRIFNFPIHHREPAVQILGVHLENMQMLTFHACEPLKSIVQMNPTKKMTLTQWLHYNASFSAGHHLTYLDFPLEFVWYDGNKCWKQRANLKKPCIGRLTYIHPAFREAFFLRMLLCHQKGCKGFADIRTVNNIVHYTYRSACEAIGLLGDDKEWSTALEEASVSASSSDLRSLFASILATELIFVYGHGGTGKTFLWKAIITALKARGKIVLAVASSGIASLLLPSGRTTHSRFKLPLVLTDESMCNVKKNTQMENLLQKTGLIVWDEAPMINRRCFEALDRSLRDILDNNDVVFGGMSVILGGDFKQTLSIKKRGRRKIYWMPPLLAHICGKNSSSLPSQKTCGCNDLA
ncbi:uncharacterized protein [Rutidosis leptorrhynchoides]|uniref:uncharacterized protein n=1 Tax=Rutidosis leptorrhynchoides TaxID=125765 RepID=UPI003A99EBE2